MAYHIMFGDIARVISVGFDSCFDRAFTIRMSEDLIFVTGTNFPPHEVYKLSTSFVDRLATDDVLFSPFFECTLFPFILPPAIGIVLLLAHGACRAEINIYARD